MKLKLGHIHISGKIYQNTGKHREKRNVKKYKICTDLKTNRGNFKLKSDT